MHSFPLSFSVKTYLNNLCTTYFSSSSKAGPSSKSADSPERTDSSEKTDSPERTDSSEKTDSPERKDSSCYTHTSTILGRCFVLCDQTVIRPCSDTQTAQTERQTDGRTDGQTGIQTDRPTDRQTAMVDKQTNQTDRIDRQTGRQTDRQSRLTDRQTDIINRVNTQLILTDRHLRQTDSAAEKELSLLSEQAPLADADAFLREKMQYTFKQLKQTNRQSYTQTDGMLISFPSSY